MEIDIILTAFNNPSYLVECVKSLQSQTFKNFRVIVIDDCSHEPMLPHIYGIVNKDARFELNENKSNLGGPINFLTRARDSKAKYIMWLHHDDWLHPDFLQKAYAGLEQNTEAAFAYCLCARVIDGVVKNEFPTSIRPDLQTGIHDISYDAVINCWIMWS